MPTLILFTEGTLIKMPVIVRYFFIYLHEPSIKHEPFTRISLEGAGSFGVPSRFAWYNLYVYCTARSSWFDVGPVLEINRTALLFILI